VLLDKSIGCSQLLVLLSSLELIGDHGLDVVVDRLGHLLLKYRKLLLLLVQLFSFGDDLFLLTGETLINFSLLPLLLQQPDSLQGSLTLHNKGTHLVQILIADLRFRVLRDVFVDPSE